MTTSLDGARPRASRLTLLLPVVVVVLTATMILWSAWPTIRPARPVTVVQAVFDRTVQTPVRTAQAQPGKTVLAPGWLEPEPFSIACTALADGVIETIEVLEGDQVTKGQIVARLVADDSQLRLANAKARLDSARAALALADADLLAAQQDWDENIDRERAVEFARGAVGEIEAELAQLPSLIAAAQATLERLQEELTWAEASMEGGAVTSLEVFVAQRKLNAQQATVDAVEARAPLLKAKLDQRQADLRAAERHLDLRIEERLRLDTAKAMAMKAHADLDGATAARDDAALELERMTIRAPIDGYVQRRLKMPGDKAVRMADDPHSAHILHLYDPSRIQVRVDVALADASNISVGQRCEVVVEVLPDQTFEGVVLRSTHEADLQKNTLQFKVGVIDPSPLLRPEMLTRVKFLPRATGSADPTDQPTSRVLVPIDALREASGQWRVWTVKDRRGDRGIARPIPIEIVSESDDWATVSGSLAPGEILVVDADDLHDGQRVRVRRHTEEGA